MTDKTKTYTIYASRIAGKLRKKGFEIIGKGINARYPEFDTFLFQDTPEFRQTLKEICNEKQ